MVYTLAIKTAYGAGVKEILAAAAGKDWEGVCDALRADGRIVGLEGVLHAREANGEAYWEVIRDLSDYTNWEDREILLEDGRRIWAAILDLEYGGVHATLIGGSCGLCDEFHLWLAAPKEEVQGLLRRVVDGNITTDDVDALRHLPGVRVEAGEKKEVGWYSHYEVLITVTVSGRDNYNGVYRFVDVVYDVRGGNSGEVRDLAPTWKEW